jgi:ribosomal-protein-alanine N-acetyltransferase
MKSELSGDHIRLRRLRESDAPIIAKVANDPLIGRFTPVPHPYTETQARAFIRYAMNTGEDNSGFVFGLVLPGDDEIMGVIELGDIKQRQRQGTIGYWLGKEHRRRGYMSEAIRLILALGFEDLNLHRVQAYVDPTNEASRKLLEKLGFACEGLLRDIAFYGGEFHDRCMYAILGGE